MAVHHAKKPGKRRRLRRAGSSSESSPSPSSDSEDSKRPHPKPSGGTKGACCCWARGRSWHRQRSESLEALRSAYSQDLEEDQAGQEASCGVGSDCGSSQGSPRVQVDRSTASGFAGSSRCSIEPFAVTDHPQRCSACVWTIARRDTRA
ncbi:hypothetical protein Pcac1_g28854 [Phytophthora cactorum]|nr:hypothetical protein Pcac1_g28854 [Phytophthora cactorum]